MRAHTTVLTDVIGAIGRDTFARATARALLDFVRFDLAAVVFHPRAARPAVMFDNFDVANARGGLDNYVSVTHAVNPILRRAVRATSVVRARDFAVRADAIAAGVRPYLVRSADEEMGFRTVGWPSHQEEIGLYVAACDGVVELSFYRERGRCEAPRATLEGLQMLAAPIAAAFETHAALAKRASLDASERSLSPREAQVVELMLAGCSSEAIALRLDISRHTVKDHRKRIFRKLEVGSLAELFALHRRHTGRS